MTTVVGYKNANGVVIAADSQVTFGNNRSQNAFTNYYKVNQLGSLPIITGMWGSATLQGQNVPTVLEEFWQTRFNGNQPKKWTVQEISSALHEFLKERTESPKNQLNMLVAGYSSKTFYPDLYEFSTDKERVHKVSEGQQSMILWRGITDAIRTLWWGYGPNLENIMKKAGVSDKKQRAEVMKKMSDAWAWGPARMNFNMPIEDAAELVEFLVNLECIRQRFWPGIARSSGSVDVAVVTVHGVNWIKRKEGVR